MRKFIIIILLLLGFQYLYSKDIVEKRISVLLNSSIYLKQYYIHKPTYSFGLGGSYRISNITLTSLLNMMTAETDFETSDKCPGPPNCPQRSSKYKFIYIILSLEGQYKIVSLNNKFDFGLGVGLQNKYHKKTTAYLIEGGYSYSYTINEFHLENNFIKSFIYCRYSMNRFIAISLYPFYLKNLKYISDNLTDYGCDFRIQYLF